MYFGNNGGLLEFNGVTWKRYTAPNGSSIRAVRAVGNRIYTGCYMDFGYWDTDPTGNLIYTSLSKSLGGKLLPDEQFWQIKALGDWIVFQSLERIYAYKLDSGEISILPSEAGRSQLFEIADQLYYRKDDEGLMQLQNGVSEVVIPETQLKSEVLVGMFQFQGKLTWLAESGYFYSIEQGRVKSFLPDGLQLFPSLRVYSAAQLGDGSLALGTISDGLILLKPDGSFLAKIGKEEGLNNNTVLSVFEDNRENLWLGLDNGISVINRGSAFSEYRDKAGDLGVVYAAREYNGKLYLGTNQGLFLGSLDAPAFELIPGTEGQVWCLREFDGILLCGHHKGTFQITGNRASLIADTPGTWSIKEVPGKDGLLAQGGYQGISFLGRSSEGWSFKKILEGFGISSRFFEFTDKQNVVVNHEYKGIYKLSLDSSLSRVSDSSQTPPFGFGASLFKFRDDLYYANSSGIFRYGEQNEFIPDSTLNALLHTGIDDPVGILISEEHSQRLWGIGNRTIYNVVPDPLGRTLQTQNIPVPEDFRRSIGVVGFECLVPLMDGRYLIGRSDGYLIMDFSKLKRPSPEIFLNHVSRNFYNTDSVQLLPLKDHKPVLPYKQNSLEFSYSVPVYDKYFEVAYQYWIEGFQDNWGPWSTQASMRVENLPYGKYTFHVRSRIGNALSDNEIQYDFEIERPWYLQVWAIVLFGFISIGIGFIVHRSYKAYYRRQQSLLHAKTRKRLKQKALKARRKLVEMRNANLRQEIESKNRELAVSTMSIIKKNEFLNAIKDQLKKVDNSPEVRSVIRTIDKNINNEEDWEFFESAFNNADQDFLQNVKKRHPQLTPNDLKLCAYLRLNLSSKEIAPLLNISLRSVEVKRYRLRKKMGLDHEDSLVNYILSL
jgi:DNA-binding CsgD family transcriptional regulator